MARWVCQISGVGLFRFPSLSVLRRTCAHAPVCNLFELSASPFSATMVINASILFFGVLVFRGVSRVFPARAGSFPAVRRHVGVFLAGGGGLIQAGGGQPQLQA